MDSILFATLVSANAVGHSLVVVLVIHSRLALVQCKGCALNRAQNTSNYDKLKSSVVLTESS